MGLGLCFHSHGLKVFIGQWERSRGKEEKGRGRGRGSSSSTQDREVGGHGKIWANCTFFPSLGRLPGPCHYRESTPNSRRSPTGWASPFWALLPDEILRLFPLIHEETSLQGRRGNLLKCQSILQFRSRSAASLSSWLSVSQTGLVEVSNLIGLCDKR